jgi:hypothetical protein
MNNKLQHTKVKNPFVKMIVIVLLVGMVSIAVVFGIR